MHSSDPDLIAYLDGELALVRRWRVKRHLDSCWKCRARVSAMESKIVSLSVAMDQWSYPGRNWRNSAKARLASKLEEVEAALPANVVKRPHLNLPCWAGASAAAVAFAFVVFFLLHTRTPKRLDAAATIAQVSEAESKLNREPLEQEFDARLEELKPSRASKTNTLRVVSDANSHRFTSRWTDGHGALKHAIWKPLSGPEQVLQASRLLTRTPRHGESTSLLRLADDEPDLQKLESGFLRWLEDRTWRSVSFASDLASWSKTDGTVMTAERVVQDGSVVVRITARRQTRSLAAILTVDVDSNDYRPRLQTIQFQSTERTVQLRLATRRVRALKSSEITDALFHPDSALLAIAKAEPLPVLPPPTTDFLPPTLSVAEPAPNLEELRAVEAQYVLHRARTCLEEPVQILEENGHVHVRSRSKRASNEEDIVTSWATLRDVLDALAGFRNRTMIPADAPQLTRANRSSSTILQHASSLVQLADLFPAKRTNSFPPEAWRLLQLIVSDHTTAIQGEITTLSLPYTKSERRAYAPRSWRESASTLNDKLRLLDELVADDRADEAATLGPEIEGELGAVVSDFATELSASRHGAAQRAAR